jgi:ribosome-associated protein
VDALEERKGENIFLMDVQKVASFTEYFVLCTATSDRMLDALGDAVLEKVRTKHQRKGRVEGDARDGWLVVDYHSIVVHLFAADLRNYYRLEDLWHEGKVLLHVQ